MPSATESILQSHDLALTNNAAAEAEVAQFIGGDWILRPDLATVTGGRVFVASEAPPHPDLAVRDSVAILQFTSEEQVTPSELESAVKAESQWARYAKASAIPINARTYLIDAHYSLEDIAYHSLTLYALDPTQLHLLQVTATFVSKAAVPNAFRAFLSELPERLGW